jgi:hypothetical protein
MDIPSITIGAITETLNLRRLLAVLALTIALLAIPAFTPADVDARRMSERTVSRLCGNAGGSIHYDFESGDFSDYSMTCTLPSGNSFTCTTTGGPFGDILNC